MCILKFDLNRIRTESCDSKKLKAPDGDSVNRARRERRNQTSPKASQGRDVEKPGHARARVDRK